MSKKFYVTTPIYYWNWLPHVWHFYSSTIANIIYKFHKISWEESRFTTWIDENSQKAVLKAQEAGMDIMDYLNHMASEHQKVWDHFNLDYTDFIRTTSPRHHKVVKNVLQKCFDKWDIYEGIYEWMYCVGCEWFKKDEDLVFRNKTTWETFPVSDKVKISDNIEKVCPDHLKAPDNIKEKNYFFKLSKYQTWMEEFYEANPWFVNPDFRYNEVKAFVKRWLEDFSISRETNTFWIPLPFDDKQVTYVWFDALFNYYTSCIESRWWDKNSTNYINEEGFWIWEESERKILHIVWKDIIRFHAIFWPAMLASYFDLWEEINWVLHYKKEDNKYLPTEILTWWFFTVDGQKMSKTIWNVIEPVTYSQEYSKELLTLYMLSAFAIGRDWDYDRKDAIYQYNAKLANNLWNLVNRVVVLSLKLESKLDSGIDLDYKPEINFNDFDFLRTIWVEYNNFWDLFRELSVEFNELFKSNNLKGVLDLSFRFLDVINDYTTKKEPWKTIKEEDLLEETKKVLFTIAESLRFIWTVLYPFFPEKIEELFIKLGLSDYKEKLENWELESLRKQVPVFNITEKWEPLFARFDV